MEAIESVRMLDRNSAVPLYHQLYIELRRRLLSEEWAPGDPFPKDSDIEAAYSVSRITARQAVANLVDGNFVVRYRGKGTFVGNLPQQGARVNHRRVADEIEALGGVATHTNVSFEKHVVSDVTAEQLAIGVGDEVGILKRLHFNGGTPFCEETIMLSVDAYPSVFNRVLLGEETLSNAYNRLGIEVVKCDQTVNAILPAEERRRALELPSGAPLLFVERIGFAANNQPLDLRRLYYRSDVFALRQEVIWGAAEQRIV